MVTLTKLNKAEKKQLGDWIGSVTELELLYAATQHGLKGTEFHAKCDNKGPTVSIAYSANGCVYGGYTSQNWQSTGNHAFDNSAFLFTLRIDNKTEFQKFKILKDKFDTAILNDQTSGPAFGGGDMVIFKGDHVLTEGTPVAAGGILKIGNTYNSIGFIPTNFEEEASKLLEVEVYSVKVGCSATMAREANKPWRQNDMEWGENDHGKLYKNIKDFNMKVGVKNPKLLLVGPIGAGKSSFINTVNSITKGYVTQKTLMGTCPHSLTTKFKTYHLNKQKDTPIPLRMCDTMGLEEEDDKGLQVKEFTAVLEGHVAENYSFNAASPITNKSPAYIKKPEFKNKVHCVAFVVDGSTVDVMQQGIIDKIIKMKQEVTDRDLPVVVLLTKVDKLCCETEQDLTLTFHSPALKDVIENLASKLNILPNTIIPVKNYEAETDLNSDINQLVLNAIRQILRLSHDYIEDAIDDEVGGMGAAYQGNSDDEN